MKIEIPERKQIIIIEGVAGSGKTTLRRYLRKHIEGRPIYDFGEASLLLCWKHIHIPRIASLRLDYHHRLLDYIEKVIQVEPDALVILDRFHLSHKILEWEFEPGNESAYNQLLERLKRLPVFIYIARLEVDELEKRMYHRDRRDPQWQRFIQEKLELRKYKDLKALSIDQQEHYFKLAAGQGIPFAAIRVELNDR